MVLKGLALRCTVCQNLLIASSDNNLVCHDNDHLVVYYNNNKYVVAKYYKNRAVGIRRENLQYEFYASGEHPHSFSIDIPPFNFEESSNILEKHMKLLPFL